MRADGIKFREQRHLALPDAYITVYASLNCEPMVVWQSTVRRDGNSGGITGPPLKRPHRERREKNAGPNPADVRERRDKTGGGTMTAEVPALLAGLGETGYSALSLAAMAAMEQMTLYGLMERLIVHSRSITTTEHTMAFFGDTPMHGVELSDDTAKIIFP